MKLKDKKVGFILTGSFCTFSQTIPEMKHILEEGAEVIPNMSANAEKMDTKFGKAQDFIEQIEKMTGKKIISTIQGAEPIGPKQLTDIMLIAPCTGNTIGKLANGITDTPATMATKSHLSEIQYLPPPCPVTTAMPKTMAWDGLLWPTC